MAQSYDTQRREIVAAARLLFRAGVMSHSGHGNMSVRLEDETMLLTSGGVLADLEPAALAVVSFEGEITQGALDPTTREIVSMHAIVYREQPTARAIIHTHSPNATSFALAHQPLPCAYEALLRYGLQYDIPLAPWGPRGSQASVRGIRDTLRANPGFPALLLANHGLLATGPSIEDAARLVVAIEEAATITLGAAHLGGARGFPPGALDEVRAQVARFAGAADDDRDGGQ